MTLTSCRAEDAVRISVMDTGCGIPPGHEEKIFERYHTTKQQGLGLGLSLSRAILLAHGGRLWAENRPVGGAVCSSLPFPCGMAAINCRGAPRCGSDQIITTSRWRFLPRNA